MKKIERLSKYIEIKKLQQGGIVLSPTLTRPSMLDVVMPGTPIDQTVLMYSSENFRKAANYLSSRLNPHMEKLQPDIQAPEPIDVASKIPEITTLTVADTKPTTNNSNFKGLSQEGAKIASGLAIGGIQVLDQTTMGDKNFSAGSKALDTTVHAASSALMSSGNPYAMASAVALEGLNWITKAGGKTVQGYDVNINNSGYGDMGHMVSESGRFWNNMDRKLIKRNEQARMALAAADVSEDLEYELESRTNSINNILHLNQIALAGGIDTSLLGS